MGGYDNKNIEKGTQILSLIENNKDIQNELGPVLKELYSKHGFKSSEEYSNSIWDEEEFMPLPEKQIEEIESQYEKIAHMIKSDLEKNFNFVEHIDKSKSTPSDSAAWSILDSYINGAPYTTLCSILGMLIK